MIAISSKYGTRIAVNLLAGFPVIPERPYDLMNRVTIDYSPDWQVVLASGVAATTGKRDIERMVTTDEDPVLSIRGPMKHLKGLQLVEFPYNDLEFQGAHVILVVTDLSHGRNRDFVDMRVVHARELGIPIYIIVDTHRMRWNDVRTELAYWRSQFAGTSIYSTGSRPSMHELYHVLGCPAD